MSNQIQLQQRIRHIAEELEKGVSNAEITAACSSLWNISDRTIRTYISLAKDLVMGKLKQMDAVIEAVRGSVIAEEAEQNLRSNIELESKLVSIIEGKLEVEKIVNKPGGTTEVQSKPTPSHVLKAIDIIWKRRGVYKQNIPEEKTKEFSLPNIVVNSEKDKQLIEQIFKLP